MSISLLAIFVILLFCLVPFLLARAQKQTRKLRRLEEELEQLRKEVGQFYLDPLTGLLSRPALARWLEEEQGFHGLVVVGDLDDLKLLNDLYGHLVGDEILHHVGQLILGSIRQQDRAFRWGGDEFVIFFRNLDREVVEARMRGLEEHLQRFHIRSHGPTAIRFSWGIASTAGRPLQESLQEADQQMYEAKRRKKPSAISHQQSANS